MYESTGGRKKKKKEKKKKEEEKRWSDTQQHLFLLLPVPHRQPPSKPYALANSAQVLTQKDLHQKGQNIQ